MKNKLIIFSTIFVLAVGGITTYLYNAEATCSGGANCTACSTCKYCKNCSKDGGTCSVCK